MATIDDKSFIDKIIAGNGRVDQEEAPDNPWVVKIVEYTTIEGNQVWGVVFEPERKVPVAKGEVPYADRYEVETEFVRNPKIIWVREP